MIFMAKVCPKAINFATAESIHQLLALRPHPTVIYQYIKRSLEIYVGGKGNRRTGCSCPFGLLHLFTLITWSDADEV